MQFMNKIAGIVLVGGKSSRMGKNKALLNFEGLPLVEHMRKILTGAGIKDTYISGTLEGYEGIPDVEAQAGPARAIAHLLNKFSGQYERLLFIPVDMPFISTDTLRALTSNHGSVFIKDHPLPACLKTGKDVLSSYSVKGLLEEIAAAPLEVFDVENGEFANLNTPVEWETFVASRGT